MDVRASHSLPPPLAGSAPPPLTARRGGWWWDGRNLLPDATFLLSFVLLALPGLLVRYVRARVGCVGFNAVPIEELGELVPLSNQARPRPRRRRGRSALMR